MAKVAKQIEREVGQLLISDKTLQAAVCPERRRGFDGALSALASVTEVVISNDLQVAKVYLSIYRCGFVWGGGASQKCLDRVAVGVGL